MKLTHEHVEIMRHTVSRAARRTYCGGGKEMTDLVAEGFMRSLGKVAWCDDEYFTITPSGLAALEAIEKAEALK